ncbi:MAG TPA: TonB-dependent receptor [Lacunisphaera sp.]
MITHMYVRHALIGVVAAAATGLFAQTTPTAAPANDESVLQLEQFVVSSSRAEGYRATNAISATGIGTKTGDTPLAISVVTKDLISDTGLNEVREALNMVPGVLTNPVNESRAVIRGFTGLIAYRNGQYRRQLMTTWNMDQIEVIKGPAAIFFGAVRPGGIINTVTSKPEFSGNYADLKASVGTEGYYKGELYSNQVVNDKFAYRVGLGGIDQGGIRDFEYLHETYAGFSAIFKPTANQQLTLDLEKIDRERFYLSSYPVRSLVNSKVYMQAGAIAAQAGINRLTTTADSANRAYLTSLGYSGTATAANFYPLYDMFAPYDYKDSLSNDARQIQRSKTVDLEYLLKINDSLVWQTTANYAFDNTSGLQPSDGDTRPYADGSVRFRTEFFINIRDSYNFDNKLTWRFNLGSTKHTVQFGQEYQRVRFDRPGYLNPVNNSYNNSPGNSTVSGVPNKYVTYYFPGGSTPVSVQQVFNESGQTFNIDRKSYDEAFGYFVIDQASFFKDRLLVLAGARYNSFKNWTKFDKPVSNSSQSKGGLVNYDIGKGKGGITPQAGFMYKVTPNLGLFATYSESVEANTAVDADGNASEPIESQALDYGVKAEFYGGRLTSTLAYYTIDRQNLAYNDTDKQTATGRSPFFIFGNSEASEGLELESNWTPNNNYSLIVGWAHTLTAETTKSNNAVFVGRRFGGVPENTYSVWNRYNFSSEALKGLSVGLGLQHNDGTNLSQDPNMQVWLPAFTTYNAMVSYNLKLSGREVKAQLNIKNLTDERYREGSEGYFAPARAIYLSFSTRF